MSKLESEILIGLFDKLTFEDLCHVAAAFLKAALNKAQAEMAR